MATYTHTEVAGSPVADWLSVLTTTIAVIPTPPFTELVLANSDGSRTHAFGTFSFSPPSTFGGTITSLARTDTGSVIYESLTGLNVDINTFVNSSDRLGLILAGDDTFNGWSGLDNLTGLGGNDTMNGAGGNDILSGGLGNDILNGGANADTLIGGAGIDTITGGLGRDVMTGLSQRDIFDFNTKAETGKTATTRDIINDFTHGVDDIDLRTIDANTTKAGNQAFKFIGQGAFHDAGVAEVRFQFMGATKTIVSADINGNGTIDFQIELVGHRGLTASDFLL